MSPWLALGLLALLLFFSGVFSGSETGFYSLSRLRVEAEAQQGRLVARLIRLLVAGPAGLLITILIGNNLCLELLTHLAEHELGAVVPSWGRELAVTLVLTPVVFFFGELLPKDLFRRRPRRLFGFFAPVLALARLAFLPLAIPIQLLSMGLERLLGFRESELTRALGREQVLEVLQEGTRTGALAPRAQELALNVLELRAKTIASVLVPWDRVEKVDLDAPLEKQRERVASSGFSRLPALRGEGKEVAGYVLQLDVLATAAAAPVAPHLRAMLALSPDLPVDRALAKLRVAGQRLALVGTPADPRGIVTLKDLIQTISGDLAGW